MNAIVVAISVKSVRFIHQIVLARYYWDRSPQERHAADTSRRSGLCEREREIEKEGIKSGENREQWKRKSEMPQLVRIVPNIQLMLSEPSTYTPYEHSRNDILLRHPKHYPS